MTYDNIWLINVHLQTSFPAKHMRGARCVSSFRSPSFSTLSSLLTFNPQETIIWKLVKIIKKKKQKTFQYVINILKTEAPHFIKW